MSKKIAYYSLGCKLNFAEASYFTSEFIKHGFQQVEFNSIADIYIINTCTVTATANKKSRNAIKKAIKNNPDAVVIVTGCYSQLKPEEIQSIEGVDYIFGTGEKNRILSDIDNFTKQEKSRIFVSDPRKDPEAFSAFSGGQRTRSFLKIQDGCDNFCSYCTIPLARGKSRNIHSDKIINQAKEISKQGFREIILTGVNIGDFGKSSDEKFYDLLIKLSEMDSIDRFRISSIEPDLLSNDIIDLITEHPRFMPHFHIPLQSGADEMLKKMKRKYDTDLFADKISEIRKKSQDAFIGIDLIVGVPGETDKLFEESLKFTESLDISFIHVFTYSERENTSALKLKPVVAKSERKRRSEVMHKLSLQKKSDFYKSQIGKKRDVLFEESFGDGLIYGFTDNYLRTGIPADNKLINKIIPVNLHKLNNNNIFISKRN